MRGDIQTDFLMEGDAASGCGEDTGGFLKTSGRNSGLFRGNKGTARRRASNRSCKVALRW